MVRLLGCVLSVADVVDEVAGFIEIVVDVIEELVDVVVAVVVEVGGEAVEARGEASGGDERLGGVFLAVSGLPRPRLCLCHIRCLRSASL